MQLTYVKININVDGLPLIKSSSDQFWPLLGSLVEDFYAEPFIIGIFYGMNKPINSCEYLQNFVDEAKVVQKKGIVLDGKKISVIINAIICNAPAKSFVSGVKYHCGYFGCSKCIQEGDWIDNRVVYTELNSTLRTDQSFICRNQPEHHREYSMTSRNYTKPFPIEF